MSSWSDLAVTVPSRIITPPYAKMRITPLFRQDENHTAIRQDMAETLFPLPAGASLACAF